MSVKFANESENVIIEESITEIQNTSIEDANRFKILCDNINSCMGSIESSNSELLDFKNVLLKENVPPSALVKLSLITGKVFRCISDLYNPLGELLRLVKVYSEPWDKQSDALRKLHKDYETKANQLNVALRRLTQQSAESTRVKKKQNLQNWEQLFTRLQISRSHGRRWKYRMFEFKSKMEQGMDNLHEYFQGLLDEDDGLKTVEKRILKEHSDVKSRRKSEMFSTDKSFAESIPANDADEIADEEPDEYRESVEEKESSEASEEMEMKDASIGTSDSDYTQKLVLRIFNAKGMDVFEDMKCQISYGSKIFRTDCINKSKEIEEEEIRIEKEAMEASEAEAASKKTKGLIGRHKLKQSRTPAKSVEEIRKEQLDRRLRFLSKNEEIEIPIPTEVTSGTHSDVLYQSIKIVLFTGNNFETKVGRVTLDLEEIQILELPIFKEFVFQGDMITPPPTPQIKEKPFQTLEPMLFPVFEYQDDVNPNETPIQLGQLPVSCFWSRTDEQKIFHRATETLSLHSLVEELTGINLDVTTKEELTREKIDEYISPRPQTPLPPMILKTDVDDIVNSHAKQIELLRTSYELQLQELANEKSKSEPVEVVRPKSVYHKDCAVSPIFPYRSLPTTRPKAGEESRHATQEREKVRSAKSRETLSTSGPDDQEEILYTDMLYEAETVKRKKSYPDDFLERLPIYSELTNKYHEELTSKVKSEISKAIEDKLSELHQLHTDLTEQDISLALADLSFPAIFMPFMNASGTVYNPRAHQYFHPSALKNLRLTQGPSIIKLPPINATQMSVLNLFEIGNYMKVKRLKNDEKVQNVENRLSDLHLSQETNRIINENL